MIDEELVQLLTPEGERVENSEYESTLNGDEIFGFYRDMVIIRGHREEEKTARTEDYFIQELYWGSFSRTITLPEEVDVDEAEAVGKHGLLILKLPKLDKKRQTKLKVKTMFV